MLLALRHCDVSDMVISRQITQRYGIWTADETYER
jgi:hypothetical protein